MVGDHPCSCRCRLSPPLLCHELAEHAERNLGVLRSGKATLGSDYVQLFQTEGRVVMVAQDNIAL